MLAGGLSSSTDLEMSGIVKKLSVFTSEAWMLWVKLTVCNSKKNKVYCLPVYQQKVQE